MIGEVPQALHSSRPEHEVEIAYAERTRRQVGRKERSEMRRGTCRYWRTIHGSSGLINSMRP